MKPKTRILLLTGFLLSAAGVWLLLTQVKTRDRDPAKVARVDRESGSHRKAGVDARPLEESGVVPLSKRLEGRHWSDDDLENFLVAHERSRESLIAAFLGSGDPELIREAAEVFPDDPMVLTLALGCDASPDRRREWAENLKRMQPDNALAAYLMAWVDLKDGDSGAALAELWRGVELKSFDAFSREGVLSLEGLHLEFGWSPQEAKFRGVMGLPMPYVQRICSVIKQLESMSQQASSKDQATEIALLGAAIGNQFSEGPGKQLVVQQLVGLRAEEQFLRLLDPELDSPYLSDSPQSLIQQIEVQRQRILEGSHSVNYDALLAEGLLSHYIDRVMVEGESSANTWAGERLNSR